MTDRRRPSPPALALWLALGLSLCSGLSLPVAKAAAASKPAPTDIWWQHAVIYEIYPRSFQDSNGDGVGDLNGITRRLDYLQRLGVDAIWIAPMYPSPQVDFGYDISDYQAVDPQYGTLRDFDRLLAAARHHGIRIVLDMVLNHTSDRHAWFLESARSRNNSKADWYVWNDGLPADEPSVSAYQKRFEHEGRVPPNNWVSLFGGSAWEWVPARRQFYYHRFYKQQPDLNWNNPAVEAAMFGAMRFWLDRGVAGFRLDAIPSLFEDPQLRNEPETGGINAQGDPNVSSIYTDNLPEAHAVIQRLRAMLDRYPDHRLLIGETYLPHTADLDQWYGGVAHDELQLPMDMLVGFGNQATLNAAHFRQYLGEVQSQVHGSQPLLVFDNHDNTRSIDRFGDGTHDQQIAKIIATVLYTSRATALTYYGAEIGMHTSTPTRRDQVKDPIGITGWPLEKGRDGERTPMQWSAGPQAGFSTNAQTWLPVAPDFRSVNVQTEDAQADSLLHWSRRLIALRRDQPALHAGSMIMLNPDDPNVLTYARVDARSGATVVVAVNMSAQPQTLSVDLGALGIAAHKVRTLATSAAILAPVTSLRAVALPPFASWIASVQ